MLPSSPYTPYSHYHQACMTAISCWDKPNLKSSFQVSWQTQPWLRGQSRCQKHASPISVQWIRWKVRRRKPWQLPFWSSLWSLDSSLEPPPVIFGCGFSELSMNVHGFESHLWQQIFISVPHSRYFHSMGVIKLGFKIGPQSVRREIFGIARQP